MPSLRHSSRRTSRTSSPFVRNANDVTAAQTSKKEKAQSSLDGWIEPAPAPLRPSFEDHGAHRDDNRMFQYMQPLGEPPNAKTKAKLWRDAPLVPSRRSLLSRNGNVASDGEALTTPEMTPAPVAEATDAESGNREGEDVFTAPVVIPEDDGDDDYAPNAKSAARSGKAPVKNGALHFSPSRQPAPPVVAPVLAAPDIIVPEPEDRQKLHMAVNSCRDYSQRNNNPRVGQAVKEMFDASAHNATLGEVMQGILRQNPTRDQQACFRDFIKASKKRQKMEAKLAARQARTHEIPNAVPPQAADNIDASSMTPGTAFANHASHATDFNSSMINGNVPSTSFTNSSLLNPPFLSVNPVVPSTEGSTSKNLQIQPVTNGESVQGSKAPSPQQSTPGPSPQGESDSDLSDYNEEIVQNGPPEVLQPNGGAPSAESGKKSNKAKQVKGKKIKITLGKRSYPPEETEETRAQELENLAKRQGMAHALSYPGFSPPEESYIRSTSRDIPSSPGGDSLTPLSQQQAPTPETASPPAQAGVNGPAINVARTQLESAPSTRPSTPSLALPGPKRIKLNNGQAAKTKRSPVKNRDGPVAGVPRSTRAGGGPGTPIGFDDNAASPRSENDDYCAACNGTGLLICCDSCNRSFHFNCCDPPLKEDGPIPNFFQCHVCARNARATEEPTPRSKIMTPLLLQLEPINVRSFVLPPEIRDRYEGVETKKDGSYAEPIKKIQMSKGGNGFPKLPDYTETLRKDKVRLCAYCGKSAAERPMIECDFCHENWHFDCADLVNPPPIIEGVPARNAWRCPRHFEHVMKSGQVLQRDLNSARIGDTVPSYAAPRRIRKPKNPNYFEPAAHRGVPNNGLIEVIPDPDDETDGEGNYVFPPAFPSLDEETDQNGKVYRLAEKGIILDFIDKVKASRVAKPKRKQPKKTKLLHDAASSYTSFTDRPLAQQQAALQLTQFARRESDIGMDSTDIHSLALALTAEAPAEVIDPALDPKNLTTESKTKLEKMRSLIDSLLQKSTEASSTA